MTRQRTITRLLSSLGALLLVAGLAFQVFLPGRAFAAGPPEPIGSPRSLKLEPGSTDGGSAPGGNVKHLFNFKVDGDSSNYSIESISFQYCTTAEAVPNGVDCNAPAGLDVSGAAISTDNGGITGFSVVGTSTQCDNSCTSDNVVTIGLLSPHTVAAPTTVNEELSGIINPSTANQTFFVRIYTYAAANGGTLAPASSEDYGTVAASTTNAIDLAGTMPESLVFCTGATITINASNVPDCTTATAGSVSFNELFSPSSTAWATSQMAASTNAGTGYVITVNGPTMTSGGGSNVITAIGATAATSQQDTRQFGLNVVDDSSDTTLQASTPALAYFDANGGNVYPVSDGSDYRAQAATTAAYTTDFSTAGSYAFVANTNNIVAASDYSAGGSTGTPGPTDTQRYTSTYIVNVSGNQPAGTYTTTLTYICTPTF